MSAQFTAVLDANVLHPAPLCDLLLELAVSDLFQARWSVSILNELRSTFEKVRPDISRKSIESRIAQMNDSTRDCLVSFPDELIGSVIGLPDSNDRHVVAAAIQSRSHAIITRNLKDFPKEILAKFRLEAIDPDTFLVAQFDLNQGAFMECVSRVRKRLKNPVLESEAYLNILIRNGLVGTAGLLRPLKQFI